jgi:integrase
MARPKLTIPQPRLVEDSSGMLHVSYTHPVKGYTVKRSTGTRDRAEAEKKMPGIAADIINPTPSTGAGYTMGELLDQFERAKCAEGKNTTFYVVQKLKGYFGGFRPQQLRSDAVWAAYRTWRTQQRNSSAPFVNGKTKGKVKVKNVSDATACRELAGMRAAINWARRNNVHGLEGVEVHIPDEPAYEVHTYLTRDQVHALLDGCAEPHTELFVLIALATGARMSAILELKWDGVRWPGGNAPADDDGADVLAAIDETLGTFDAAKLRLFDFKTRDDIEPLRFNMGRGRGNKKRPTGGIARTNARLYFALLRAWQERAPGCPYVIQWRGNKIDTISLKAAYARAGLTQFARHNHLLKHTCCSLLVQAGQSFQAVGKMVGTDAKTIERHYGHLSPSHLETAGEVLSF